MTGLLIFFTLWSGLAIRLYSKHHKAALEQASRLPLDGDDR